MKSIYELTEEQWMKSPSNNWLKAHGFAMFRNSGKRKHPTKNELRELESEVPFK